MSTLVSHPTPAPAWKQEVNRRIAEHKNRKGLSIVQPEAPSSAPQTASTRAAQAAARVAARYAKAPSYSEMQAAEARTAVRAAEIATLVALDAQAAANVALAGLEAASCEVSTPEPERPCIVKPEAVSAPAVPPAADPFESAAPAPRQMPEMFHEEQKQVLKIEPPAPAPRTREPRQRENYRRSEPQPEFVAFDIPVEDWWRPAPPGRAENIAEVEPDQPIHANLIEFPRELVAAHKARPRLAEGSNVAVADPVGQLSIFEVDPGAIALPAVAAAELALPVPFEWSGIQLDPEPLEELELEPEPARVTATTLQLAPLSRRLLAAVVDGQLIAGVTLAATLVVATHMDQLPALRIIESGAAIAILVMGLLYLTLFSALAGTTPGMKYAGISLCTFDNQCPTLAQRCGRLSAMFMSVLPLGLGVAWAIFDEDHLSWHDRLSRTYQRRS